MKKFNVTVNGEVFEVEVEDLNPGQAAATAAPAPVAAPVVETPAPAPQPKAAAPAPKPSAPAGGGSVTAPMPGNIWKVLVSVGDQVNEGDSLIILEAMKMENEIPAPCSGTVKEVAVEEGQAVAKDALLVVVG